MNDGPGRAGLPAGDGTGVPTLPEVVDRAAWQAQLDALLVREKAHTRERDAIAAARRRLAMVEADPSIPLTGEHGPVTLLDVPWYSAQDCASALLGGRWFGTFCLTYRLSPDGPLRRGHGCDHREPRGLE